MKLLAALCLVTFVVVQHVDAQTISEVSTSDPAELIDPLIGSEGTGRGSCMPGPCLPHASVYPSPDSGNGQLQPSGYDYKGGIVGFSQLHAQGTGGAPSYGNLLVSPQVGLEIDEKQHLSEKTDEVAKAYQYSVTLLKYGIKCQFTPSAHSVLYKFTFPASDDSHIIIDVARKIGLSKALDDGDVRVDPESGVISGGGVFSGNWTPGRYKLFFTAAISKKPDSFGTWVGSVLHPGERTSMIKGTEGGAYFGFPTSANEVVYLKIALSFKSTLQSAAWLQQEVPDWNFEQMQNQARTAWIKQLESVSVEGSDENEIMRFYTALFHSMVQPRDRTNDILENSDPFWDDHYTLWDSWRTLYPLLGLTDARSFSGILNSFIIQHQRNGYVPEALVGGVNYAAGQGGNEVDNIITEAFLNQIPGVDWNQAYAIQLYDAEEMRTANYRSNGYASVEEPKHPYAYRMKSGGATLEFAYNDFCVAQMAKSLNKQDDYKKYESRSHNWENVWNPAITDSGFSGFPNSRHVDGSFSNAAARQGYNTDFYEGSCWIYSYRPTYALPDLIQKMGGETLFLDRLDFALQNKLIDFTNEPSFQTIWLWSAVNRPYLSSYWADYLKKLYKDRAMPGDEDGGAMSSLYCFLDLGIFPFAGQDIYYLHGGRLAKVAFHLHNGKIFTILSQNASPSNIYVQSATLNGQVLDTPYIRHSDIFSGGTLNFVMGPKPSVWACSAKVTAEDIQAQVTKLAKSAGR